MYLLLTQLYTFFSNSYVLITLAITIFISIAMMFIFNIKLKETIEMIIFQGIKNSYITAKRFFKIRPNGYQSSS